MNIRQSFRMSIKSIRSNKVRSFLTMLGIIIGVAAVIILVSLVQGYRNSLMEYWAKQGQNKISVYYYSNYYSSSSNNELAEELYDYCLTLSDYVEGITPSSSLWGTTIKYQSKTISEDSSVSIYLGSEQYSICENYTVASGRDLSYVDIKNMNRVCVIGDYVREQLFNYADPVGETITVNGEPLTVIGVYEAKYEEDGTESGAWYHEYYDGCIVIPYTLTRVLDPSTEITEFTVKAVDKEGTTKAITLLGGWFSGKIDSDYGYYDISSANEYIESSDEETKMLSWVLGGIAGIALLVGGIGIMNIMLVTVTERTREIGIRKAIGAERRVIISQFMIESSVLSFVGGIIGIMLGFLGTVILGKVIFDLTLFPSSGISLAAAGISVGIGMVFGAYPAIRASGLQPVVALRSE